MSNKRVDELADEGRRVADEFMKIVERNQRAVTGFMASPQKKLSSMLDPFNVAGSFARSTAQFLKSPDKILQANMALWQKHVALWQYTADRLRGEDSEPVAQPTRGDRRFRSDDWQNNLLFDLVRQSYLINSRWLDETMADINGLSEDDAHKLRFYTRQLTDALSPSNFLLTNPEVMKETIRSRGKNLVNGFRNLRRDFDLKSGQLKLKLTDTEAYEVGVNVATTPGKIVYQNDLMQLIQYSPTTDKTFDRPLLISPPWINKFYILDLQPENSFIKWAVDKGYTVFVISWVNPGSELADKTMDDYMDEGLLEAIDAVERATGQPEVTMIGYCIGGTLAGATLARMAALGDDRVKAVTFFAAQMDFEDAGDLKVFIDEEQLDNLDCRMQEKGYLTADDMSTAFNMLRANDLIWSVYVNNYLLGKEPPSFDLLYWNADATRMPRALHMFYLREMYQKNNLAKPGGISLGGTPIDLGKIEIPVYLQSSHKDHIAPYESVFKAKNLFSGPVRFVLAGSGHIAGVINPPAAEKYNYWMNEDQPDDLDEWMEGAESHPGSWWEDWHAWLSPFSGEMVDARQPGDGTLKVIEDAPGSYVKAMS